MHLASIAVGGGCIIAALIVVEVLSRWTGMGSEASRKLAHLIAGLIVVCLPLFMPVAAVAVLAAAFIPLMLLSRRFSLLPSIHNAERRTLGEVYYPLGVLLAAILFSRPLLFAFGVAAMAISDAVAGIVGVRYGRHPYSMLGARKTVEGSAGFLIATVPLAIAALIAGGAGIGEAVALALVLAIVLTLIESAFGWGLDNTVLPAVGAFLLSLVVH